MASIAWLVLLLAARLSAAFSLPSVDPGLFVIMGVRTCRLGQGYCLLGLDCTMDEDFLADDQGGHCDGLRSAFTPSAHFICCRYNPKDNDTAGPGDDDDDTAAASEPQTADRSSTQGTTAEPHTQRADATSPRTPPSTAGAVPAEHSPLEHVNELFPLGDTLQRGTSPGDAGDDAEPRRGKIARVLGRAAAARAALPRNPTGGTSSNEVGEPGDPRDRTPSVQENEISNKNHVTPPSQQNYLTSRGAPLLTSTEESAGLGDRNGSAASDQKETTLTDDSYNYTTVTGDMFVGENETEATSPTTGEAVPTESPGDSPPASTTVTSAVAETGPQLLPQTGEATPAGATDEAAGTDASTQAGMGATATPSTARPTQQMFPQPTQQGAAGQSTSPGSSPTTTTGRPATTGAAGKPPWRCGGSRRDRCWTVEFADSRDNRTLCRGSFLDANTVLTSAKCVVRLFSCGLEEVKFQGDADRISSARLKDVLVHEDYDIEGPMAVLNDLGMVRLHPGEDLRPECALCLPQVEDDFMGQRCCSPANAPRSVPAGGPPTTGRQVDNGTYSDCGPADRSGHKRAAQTGDDMAGSPLLCGSVLAGVASITEAGAIFTPTTDHLPWIRANMA